MKLETLAYRAHHPGWAFDPLSGAGAARHGGRFNAKGAPALYTSLSWQTAWTEVQQAFPYKTQPVTICTYAVACEDVEDLSDAATLERLGIKPSALSAPWEDQMHRGQTPVTWSIAERLRDAGTAAIIVPSFASAATIAMKNLVFWDWSDTPPHQVKVIDDEGRLPLDRSSWS